MSGKVKQNVVKDGLVAYFDAGNRESAGYGGVQAIEYNRMPDGQIRPSRKYQNIAASKSNNLESQSLYLQRYTVPPDTDPPNAEPPVEPLWYPLYSDDESSFNYDPAGNIFIHFYSSSGDDSNSMLEFSNNIYGSKPSFENEITLNWVMYINDKNLYSGEDIPIIQYQDPPESGSIVLKFMTSSYYSPERYYRLYMNTNTDIIPSGWNTSSFDIAPGPIYNVCFTYKINPSEIELYINGYRDGIYPNEKYDFDNPPKDSDITYSNFTGSAEIKPMYLGNFISGSPPPIESGKVKTLDFNHTQKELFISKFLIYNRKLSKSEIRQNHLHFQQSHGPFTFGFPNTNIINGKLFIKEDEFFNIP